MRFSNAILAVFLIACGATSSSPAATPEAELAARPPGDARARALCDELEPEVEHGRCAFWGDGITLPGGARVEVLEAAGSRDDGVEQTVAYLILDRPGEERVTATVVQSEDYGGGGEWTDHELGELTLDGGNVSLTYTVRDRVYACTGGPPECSPEESQEVTTLGERGAVITCPIAPEPDYLWEDLCERAEP
ncbi:MAG: hypothetical protein R3B82_16315 [Sandaracinaceae bacterium]